MTTRDSYLRRRYGITAEQFDKLVRFQRGACPVCRRSFDDIPGTPHVDHDHWSGEIRGILCGHCNHRVVGRHRDPALLRRASEYLTGPFTGWVVPKKPSKRKSRSTARRRK